MRKIDDQVLYRMVVEEGQTQSEVAAYFGVSEAAVSKRVKALNFHLNRHVGLERAKEVADHGLNVVGCPWPMATRTMGIESGCCMPSTHPHTPRRPHVHLGQGEVRERNRQINGGKRGK